MYLRASRMPDPNLFAEWGLPGVVIGCLIAIGFMLIRGHKEERTQWRADIKELAEKSDQTNRENTITFAELHDKMFQYLTKEKRNQD